VNVATFESGYERDSLHARRDVIRWWMFCEIQDGRYQPARQGVVDRGFRFARGGRATTPQEAEYKLQVAREEANVEWRLWTHQPSHMLGARGELIPLDEFPLELEAS
jgi:hypothetical protein